MAKKLVRGDYKSGRVRDPAAKLSSKHEKTVKNYVKDFMDKAVRKKEEREKAKASRGDAANDDMPDTPHVDMDDTAEADISPNDSSSELKRKREDEADESPRNMRSRTDEPPAPPPPPPPPADDMPIDMDESLTPMDAGSMAFLTEEFTALSGKAVLQASGHPVVEGSLAFFTEEMAPSGKAVLQASGQLSPMQLATPPTNGSSESRTNGSSNLR